jgi:hypothetical protein
VSLGVDGSLRDLWIIDVSYSSLERRGPTQGLALGRCTIEILKTGPANWTPLFAGASQQGCGDLRGANCGSFRGHARNGWGDKIESRAAGCQC